VWYKNIDTNTRTPIEEDKVWINTDMWRLLAMEKVVVEIGITQGNN
jgi:hypothetical protein